jgi:phospholipase/lecithinase/hemolysin
MKNFVLSLSITLTLLSVSIADALDLNKVHNLVVFGDSLSDNGNSYVLFGVPQPPYYDGRWTNGLNWVDYFTRMTGLPPATAFLEDGSTNFAVGGATSVDLPGEAAVYLGTVGGKADPNDLYVVWIGANDFLAGIQPATTADTIIGVITGLRAAGAQNFLLMTVPDIALTPDIIALGETQVQAAKQFVTDVNHLLRSEISSLAIVTGAEIVLIEVNPLLQELVHDPAAFGFKNSTGEAYNPSTGVVVKHPNQYVFWDGFHPTTRVHRIAAETFKRDVASSNAVTGQNSLP